MLWLKETAETAVLTMKKNVSILNERLEKTSSDHKLDEAKLADIPLDVRKKEARKPLFITRYE